MAKKIILNHKCNLTKEEYTSYLKKMKSVNNKEELVVCPSLCYLSIPLPDNLVLGSQNVSNNNSGAHTGEISSSQLKSLAVKYCLVGHNERRKEQFETEEDITKKINNLLIEGITPILCIGETLEDYQQKIALEKILQEISKVVEEVKESEKDKIIIAYEPIWSIGTGKTITQQELDHIISKLKEKYPQNKILYGGSIDEKNIEYLKKITGIDGYLLGSLSLDPTRLEKFLQVLKK